MNNKTAINKTLKMISLHNLIQSGDHIAVGVSGGKDSMFLLKVLSQIQKFYDKPFKLTAICINMQVPNMDLSIITEFCKKENIELKIVPSDIYEVVFNIRKEKNPCSLCAKLRRGLLCSFAKEIGANKLALGHHSDDLIETFFLSLFYEGRLSTLAPKSFLDRTKITVIRPLLLISEQEIKDYVSLENLPIVKNLCPADHHTQRETLKNLVNELDSRFPKCKENIFNAITSPNRYNLWKEE